MNIFSGKSALKDFYDPEKCPPLPLVELPNHPFENDGVQIFAKMLTMLPAANVNPLPALNMMLRLVEMNADTKRIIERSSGNTSISLAILSRIHGLGDVSAYVSNKDSEAKMQLLRFFGLELSLFGGPAPQATPGDRDGGIHAVINNINGAKAGCHPLQYTSAPDPEAHTMRWTGPQLHKQLPDMAVFAGLGTGTIPSVGTYLKSVNPDTVNVGVFTTPEDKVPGPCSIARPQLPTDIGLPKDGIDEAEFATSVDSYRTSIELCRQGLLIGPRSGSALVGLYHFLEKAKADGRLERLRGVDGKVKCAFICCDQPFQHIADYFKQLPPSVFPAIVNDELLEIDQYPYSSTWTITLEEGYRKLEASDPERATLLDLRDSVDFEAVRIIGSINMDLHCKNEPDPFTNPPVLRRQWLELDRRLDVDDPQLRPKLFGRVVVINSYNGHTAVVASSVLRKKGVEAYAVEGGFRFGIGFGCTLALSYGRPASPKGLSKGLVQVSRIDPESGKPNVFEYKRPAKSGIQICKQL